MSCYFAFSSAVAVVNGVVGGAAVAVAVGALFDAGLAVSADAGAIAAILSIVGWINFADRLLDTTAAEPKPLFPTPGTSDRGS